MLYPNRGASVPHAQHTDGPGYIIPESRFGGTKKDERGHTLLPADSNDTRRGSITMRPYACSILREQVPIIDVLLHGPTQMKSEQEKCQAANCLYSCDNRGRTRIKHQLNRNTRNSDRGMVG